jgi:hypothetical protein
MLLSTGAMSKLSCLPIVAVLSGCLGHIPLSTTEHLNVSWRPSYEHARADAQKLGRPILVVMVAGPKDGPTCLGGDWLRTSALRDARVIQMINDQFVPVWINVRNTPIPPFPFVQQVLVTATIDKDNRVVDWFSRSFFLRSVIATPDGQTLLNPSAPTVAKTTAKVVFEAESGYQSNEPGDYLTMLKHALDRFHHS